MTLSSPLLAAALAAIARRAARFFARRGLDILAKACVAVLGLTTLPALAGLGIDLDTNSPTYLTAIGGMGGNKIAPQFCPSGQVISGFTFWHYPASPYGAQGKGIQGLCSSVSINGLVDAGTTPLMSGTAGYRVTQQSWRCPAGSVVTGWLPYRSNSGYIDGLEPYCSAMTLTSSSASVGPAVRSEQLLGGSTIAIAGPEICPAGTIASGFEGRTGEALDNIRLICYPLLVQAYQVTVEVSPPPAPLQGYQGFGLDITDAGGVVALRPAGTSKVATALLTAGPYTARPALPASHYLTASTCPASFTMTRAVNQACTMTAAPRMSAPTVALAFSPASLLANEAGTLTITVSNTSSSQTMTGLSVVDDLPAGLLYGSVAPSTTCSGATVSRPTAGRLSLTGGSIGPSGSCTVTATVAAARLGSYLNRIPPGGVSGDNFLPNAANADATLTVAAQPVVRLQKITTGAIGAGFSFSQSNLASVPGAISTAAPNVATPAAPAAIAVVAARTAVTLAESSSANFVLVSASCTDANAAQTGNPSSFGTQAGQLLTIPAANVAPGADITCVFTNAYRPGVSGSVFNDDGKGGGIPNDGVVEGAEAGITGVPVALGDCGSGRYADTVTDSAGNFALAVPMSAPAGAPLCVDVPRRTSRYATGASVGGTALVAGTAMLVAGTRFSYGRSGEFDRIAFSWTGANGSGIGSLHFAGVPHGDFVRGSLQTGRPGGAVHYRHVFTAPTAGSLSFSIPSSVTTPPADGWSEAVLADPGCTGTPQPGAASLLPPAAPTAVVAGQVICVVLRESIPQQATPGSHHDTRLEASLVFANANPALTATYSVDDVTTVSDQALDLLKEVRNLSTGTTTFGTTNKARPGDTLEYRISYANRAPTPIRTLTINDTTPTFTTFKSAAASALPNGLASCAKLTPANATVPVECSVAQAAGGQGPLEWKFTGDLAPGASGAVLFQVVVD